MGGKGVAPEGGVRCTNSQRENQRVELTEGGEAVRRKGKEGVSKIILANTDSPSLSTAGSRRRQACLQINRRTTRGVSERENNKPISSHYLSSPSIHRNHWIIYKPLPSHCVREGRLAKLTNMLSPAAFNAAAAAAVWLLALLGLGLSLPAEHYSEPGFTLCDDCFYRQTPPRGASAELPLHRHCHRLPGGQALATLSRLTCDTAVCSAFHLSHGWTGKEKEQRGETVTEVGDSVKVAVPALLRGGAGDISDVASPTDSPLQQWDSTVAAMIQSNIMPKCAALGGGVYILTGAGRLGAAEDGDEECQTKLLWSAACCAPPEGKDGFSVGVIKETQEAERQVSMKELEEMLGVAELFSEGCGGEDRETAAATVGLRTDGLHGNAAKTEADGTDENSETGDPHAKEGKQESFKVSSPEERFGADAKSENADVSHLSEETTAELVISASSSEQQFSETVTEEDSNSTSTLVFLLSTTLSILKAPLCPVFSTITEFPAQVAHVFQEDLEVLSALPGDTFTLFHLLMSDLLSWTGSAADMLLGIGETCFSSVYYCASSMVEALLSSCQAGFMGIGTLAGDTVGIFGGVLDNGWWVTKFFGGRLWEQTESYMGAVVSEMGGQAQAVGGGLGRLACRGGNGVGNVFSMGGNFIMGVLDVVFGGARDSFRQESE
ncbi:hypothetical protein CRENBAI_012616 [Crenichthys baileyi]|uniref:INO80 complex subunit E n=1 Tax=Crenichthys baileyi TaxID=28760 RepID=A0AAV9SJ11_9TELE